MKTMQKHLIALAAFGALTVVSGTASAQSNQGTESVIYGRVQTSLEGVRVNQVTPDYLFGSTHKSTSRVNSDNSFIGLRVKESLGSNLSVFADFQVGVHTDDGTLNGEGTRGRSDLRRSIVGLNSDWGTVWAGKDETAYFSAGRAFDPFYNTTSAASANILGQSPTSFNTLSPRTGFNSRFGNTVGYKSPSWYNTNVQASYSFNERDSLGDSRVSSVSLNYRGGPWLGTLAYERQNHTDALLASGVNRDTAIKAAVGYDVNDKYRVSFVAERTNNEVNAALLGSDYGRNAYSVGLTKHVTSGEILASYTVARGGGIKANNVWGVPYSVSTPEAGAKQLSLGYRHNLSRRTNIIATATLLNNKEGANYDLQYRPVGVQSGNDIRVYGVGIEHKF